MKRISAITLGTLLTAATVPVFAASGDIDFSQLTADTTLSITEQEAYYQLINDGVTEDLGSALSYKAITPAEPLGITGIDIGVALTATTAANAKDWDDAVEGGDSLSTIPSYRIMAHKGLPLGIDVGAFYMGGMGTNVKVIGGELRYAILEGGVATPALGVRVAFSKLSGIQDYDFSTQGLELSVSKGFVNLTPYAGIGMVQVKGGYKGDLPVFGSATPFTPEEYSESLTKYFAGLNINLGLLNIVVDGDKTGDSTSYSLKFGFRF